MNNSRIISSWKISTFIIQHETTSQLDQTANCSKCALMNEFRLQSNLSRRTSTYFHFQESKSIINMCLTTKNFNDRILICKTRSNLNHDLNHMFIETILNISISETSSLERYNWDHLNMKKFKNILIYLFFDQSTSQSFNSAQINVYIKFVCHAIVETMKAFTSKFITSICVIFEFDEACNLTRTQTNQVKRTFQNELVAQKNTNQTFQIWKKAKIIKKRIIRKIVRVIHRNAMFDTIENVQKTGKLAKWIKNRFTLFKSITFFFRRSNDIMTFIKKTRIQCLIDFFFFSLVTTNLDDIAKTAYSKNIDFFEIIENEINQIIAKIVSSIISKENEILNWVLKLVLSHIMLVVKWIFN
jgi:hypothetical protein